MPQLNRLLIYIDLDSILHFPEMSNISLEQIADTLTKVPGVKDMGNVNIEETSDEIIDTIQRIGKKYHIVVLIPIDNEKECLAYVKKVRSMYKTKFHFMRVPSYIPIQSLDFKKQSFQIANYNFKFNNSASCKLQIDNGMKPFNYPIGNEDNYYRLRSWKEVEEILDFFNDHRELIKGAYD